MCVWCVVCVCVWGGGGGWADFRISGVGLKVGMGWDGGNFFLFLCRWSKTTVQPPETVLQQIYRIVENFFTGKDLL